VIVAVGATADAAEIVDAAAAIARDRGAPLEIVHVRETVVMPDLAIDTEDAEHARAAVCAHLDRLAGHGIAATGQILTSVGDHAAAGRALAQHAADVDARTVAVGRSPRGPVAQFTDGSFTTALTRAAATTVVLVRTDEEPHELTADAMAALRTQ
jgi:ACDE family multidrug resistance protein